MCALGSYRLIHEVLHPLFEMVVSPLVRRYSFPTPPDQGFLSNRSHVPFELLDVSLFLAKRQDAQALRMGRGLYIPTEDPEPSLVKGMIGCEVFHIDHIFSIDFECAQVWKAAEQGA